MKRIVDLCNEVLGKLRFEGYTDWGIARHQRTYKSLIIYAKKKNIFEYSQELAKDYIYNRYGVSMNSKRGANTQFATQRITHLLKLSHYQIYGNIHYYNPKGQKHHSDCPDCFSNIYTQFIEEYKYSGHSEASISTIKYNLKRFLIYLFENNIIDLNSLKSNNIDGYLLLHKKNSLYYLKSITSSIRLFFSYIYETEYSDKDLRRYLPTIHLRRSSFIPSAIDSSHVKKILTCINRNSNIGRRDYALLIIAIRFGLRCSDIRNLKLNDFDWDNNVLIVNQNKTKTNIRIPIPLDVGWVVIDYIQYSRPRSKSKNLFIRHSPEGGAFSDSNKLQNILHKYMRIANVEYPINEHRGLHSLRSGFAKILLEQGTTLPVISEMMGHGSTVATSHYMKIDTVSLRKCAIDPEEVVYHDK
ncbi:MAG: site-specific integrase [Tenericutes bacterium]|jgi:integrase/recombinase XerD|nr:site-specific integrase [Mycoplasmatota bacterium]